MGHDARPVVGDDDLAAISDGARREMHSGVAVGLGEGVGDEGADDLLEPVGVSDGFDRSWRGDVDGDRTFGLQHGGVAGGIGEHVSEVDAAVVDELDPALITTYQRTTLTLAAGRARVTFDTDVTWAGVIGQQARLAGSALVETKTTGAPCAFDRALWRHGQRPAVLSKYGTGLAALSTGLPTNKWSRVLRRHFDPAASHDLR